MTALHVHTFNMTDGNLCCEIADPTGRTIHLDIRPEDHPALMVAYERFCATITAAAQAVMLEILDAAAVPVEPIEIELPPMVLPCKACGSPVEVPAYTPDERAGLLRTTYCDEHKS